MVETKIYAPDKITENMPAIIGLPGFIGTLKNGRIDKIFKDLSKEGIYGMAIMYDGIKKEDKKITCNFNLENYVENMGEAFEKISKLDYINKDNIGVVASSISGGIFAYGLVSNATKGIQPNRYLSISPLVGWDYFGTQEIRSNLQHARDNNLMDEFPITSEEDKLHGIQRVIPMSCLDEIEKIDGLDALKKYSPRGMEVMTLSGEKDESVSVNSMQIYHQLLGGKPDQFLKYGSEGHALSMEKTEGPIKDFFLKGNKIYSSKVA